MNKREFLSELEEALKYELPPRAIRENINYYSSYIDAERAKGRSEEEILSELGDARLIARTIIDAAQSGADGIPGTDDDMVYQGGYDDASRGDYSGGYSDGYQNYGNDGSAEYRNQGGGGSQGGGPWGNIKIHTYSGCMPCLVGLLLCFVIFSVIAGIFTMLAPILAPIMVVFLILWLLGKVGKR